MVFFKPGDIVKFRPVDRGRIQAHQGPGGRRDVRYRQVPVTFDLSEALGDPESYNRKLLENLNDS